MTNNIVDLAGWTFENVHQDSSIVTSLCGDMKLVGGYKRFGKGAKAMKNFKLPPHSRVRI